MQVAHFKRTYLASLIFTHHKLQVVAPRRKRKTSGILNVSPRHILRLVHRKLHRVTHVAYHQALRIAHLAQDVERRFVLILALGKRNLRPRHEQRHRHIQAVGILAKIEGL